MASNRVDRWLTPEGLTLVEGWARDGLTEAQIAGNMGIGRSTLYRWRMAYPEMREALRKGKEVVDYEVENALLKTAIGGNTTAQTFWLRNRRPDKWRDKPEASESGEGGGVVILAPVMDRPAPPGSDG